MITNAQDYESALWQIQSSSPSRKALLLPKDEKIYDIDLNTRKISVPKFLSVTKDHEAETIYFKFDRYYDYIDLTTKACVIQYTNANGENYIYPVPYFDVETFADEGKVIIPWCIQGKATEYAGTVKFAIKWYSINQNLKVTYTFNTLVAEGQILKGQNPNEMEWSNDEIDLSPELAELIQELEYAYNNNTFTLYWRDV